MYDHTISTRKTKTIITADKQFKIIKIIEK